MVDAEQGGPAVAGREVGEELGDVGRPHRERVGFVRGEELAVLEQVGAVGVQRVAREAALQLQVGEEVEDEALEALARLRPARRGRPGGLTAIAMPGGSPGRPSSLAAQGGARERRPSGERAAKKSGSSSRPRPIVRAGSPLAA